MTMDIHYKPYDIKNSWKVPFVAGFATYIGDAISYPFETLTTRIKRRHNYTSIVNEIRYINKNKGYKFFYNGFQTVFYSAFFTNFVYFGIYDICNHFGLNYVKRNDMKSYSAMIPTISSLIGQLFSLIVYVPVDCIQTRMQSGDKSFNYNNIFHGFRTVIREEGFLRLFHGSYIYAIHNLIFTPVIYTVYERLKKRKIYQRKKILIKRGEAVPNSDSLFTIKDSMLATIISTTASVMMTNIIYTLVVRYQLTNFELYENKDKNAFTILEDGWKVGRFMSLNRGLIVRLIVANLSAVIYLPVYEQARQYFNLARDF